MGRKVPFVPFSGSNTGLLERRLNASSWLGLSDDAEQNGDWDRDASNIMVLDSDGEYHKNNAEDPATDSLNMSDSARMVRDFNRSINDSISLNDSVHVIYCGYQPQVDNQLIEILTAGVDIKKGAPVCVLTANTANLANNYLGSPANEMLGHPIGLSNDTVSAGEDVTIITEGTVTQEDWYDITGATLLTPGAWYYLNGATAGKMTLTPPTFSGRMNIRVGRAIDTTRFDIEISEGVIL